MLKMFSASMLGMPISQLLAAAPKSGASAEHVILFWNSGGMSHLDTWDPKPGRPTQGEFNPIKTSVPGMEISEIFPQLARQMHHAALIRSVKGTNGDHGRAQYELQTGFNQAPNVTHPGLGSLVVHEREPLGDLPAYISISGQGRRAGYLGQQCEAYYVGRPGEKDPYLAFPEGIHHARGKKRLEILAKMNARTSGKPALVIYRCRPGVSSSSWARTEDFQSAGGSRLGFPSERSNTGPPPSARMALASSNIRRVHDSRLPRRVSATRALRQARIASSDTRGTYHAARSVI